MICARSGSLLLVTPLFASLIRGPACSPDALVNQNDRAFAGRAGLPGWLAPGLLPRGCVGKLWHPIDLLEDYRMPAWSRAGNCKATASSSAHDSVAQLAEAMQGFS